MKISRNLGRNDWSERLGPSPSSYLTKQQVFSQAGDEFTPIELRTIALGASRMCAIDDRRGRPQTNGNGLHHAAIGSAPPGETRSKGNRILTVVPIPSDPDAAIVPPSWRTNIAI
jgi:hypothetical protein